jgi:hypothetical protein
MLIGKPPRPAGMLAAESPFKVDEKIGIDEHSELLAPFRFSAHRSAPSGHRAERAFGQQHIRVLLDEQVKTPDQLSRRDRAAARPSTTADHAGQRLPVADLGLAQLLVSIDIESNRLGSHMRIMPNEPGVVNASRAAIGALSTVEHGR